MDELTAILPRLTDAQIEALISVAQTMVDPDRPRDDEAFTASQLAEMSDLPYRSISAAMHDGRLPYKTPHGQTRPRYATRRDFEKWSGKRLP